MLFCYFNSFFFILKHCKQHSHIGCRSNILNGFLPLPHAQTPAAAQGSLFRHSAAFLPKNNSAITVCNEFPPAENRYRCFCPDSTVRP